MISGSMQTVDLDDAEALTPGSLQSEQGALPLQALAIEARVHGLLAHARVTQTFVNAFAAPIEATYVFPLPARGAMSAYAFVVDGRVVHGVLKERLAARQEYDAAIESGKRASILEEERPEVFTVRVGNVAPGVRVEVRIDVDLLLPVADGEATLRVPLVVGERYVSGQPVDGERVGDGTAADTDRVPDASRVTPPVWLGEGAAVAFRAELVGARAASCTWPGAVVAVDAKGAVVSLPADARPDRDVIVRFPLIAREELLVLPDPGGAAGGTAVAIVCPAQERAGGALEVVVAVDTSGSMAGARVESARRAAHAVVDALTPLDRFAVLAFQSTSTVDAPALRSAIHRERVRAHAFVDALRSDGGTELVDALHRCGALLRSAVRRDPPPSGGAGVPPAPAPSADQRQRVVVLITDGQIGDEERAVRSLRDALAGARFLAVGIGMTANGGLCERLASSSGGACELVEDDARLDSALDRVRRHLLAPSLHDVELALDGARFAGDTLAPRRPPDLCAGVTLVVGGRYTGAAPRGAMLCAGRPDGSRVERALPVRIVDAPGLRRAWARLHVRDLEDEIALAHPPQREERAKALVAASLEHGVLCRHTAFVAVDNTERVRAPEDQLLRVMQPVLPPADAPIAHDGKRRKARVLGELRLDPAKPGPLRRLANAVGDVLRSPDARPAVTKAEPRPMRLEDLRQAQHSSSKTQAGVLKGKFATISPEQVRGLPFTKASDVFLLVVRLYRLLAGRPLFLGESEFHLLELAREATLPSPLVPPHLASLEPLLKRALAKDPAARFADGDAFADAVSALLSPAQLQQARQVLAQLVRSLAGAVAVCGWDGSFEVRQETLPDGRRVVVYTLAPHLMSPWDGADPGSVRLASVAALADDHIAPVLGTVDARAVVVDAGGAVPLAELARALRGRAIDAAAAAIALAADAARALGALHRRERLARLDDAESLALCADGVVRWLGPLDAAPGDAQAPALSWSLPAPPPG